jgi:hypothetical protein
VIEHVTHRDALAAAAVHRWAFRRGMFCRRQQQFGRVLHMQPVAHLVSRAHKDSISVCELAAGVPKQLLAQAASID